MSKFTEYNYVYSPPKYKILPDIYIPYIYSCKFVEYCNFKDLVSNIFISKLLIEARDVPFGVNAKLFPPYPYSV